MGAGHDGDSEVLSLLPGGQTGRTRPRLSSDLGVSIHRSPNDPGRPRARGIARVPVNAFGESGEGVQACRVDYRAEESPQPSPQAHIWETRSAWSDLPIRKQTCVHRSGLLAPTTKAGNASERQGQRWGEDGGREEEERGAVVGGFGGMGEEPLLAEPLETLPSSPEPSWRQLASSSGRGWRGTPLPCPGVQEGLEPLPAPLATQPSIPNGPKEKLRSAARPPTSLAPPPWASEGARVKR